MPYDPTYPVANSPAASAPMRAQFAAIVDLIQTIPVGPQGPQGEPGSPGVSVSGAVVDGVSTVNPGDPALASAYFDGANVHFSFGIPRGDDGQPGQQGNQGADGQQGPQGQTGDQGVPGPVGPPFTSFNVDSTSTLPPGSAAWVQTTFDGAWVWFNFGIPIGNDGAQGSAGSNGMDGAPGPEGPPFTNFTVDSTTTLDPWQPASVATTYDGTFVRFAFGIPRGNDGQPGPQGQQGPPFTNFIVDSTATLDPGQPAYVQTNFDGTNVRFAFGIPRGYDGQQGPQGPEGQQGPQGQPGEVTLSELQSAIAGTSNNSNGVQPLAITVSDPPTQGEVQQILDKLNELILALRRF